MEKLRISKSLILDWWKYKEQSFCGELFFKRYIERAELINEVNDKMMAGNRFEYQSIGSLNRDGSVPPIVTGVSGKPLQIQQTVDVQSDRFLRFIEANNIKIVKPSVKLEVDMGDYTLVGVIDAMIEFENKPGILEMKFTSLLENEDAKYKTNSQYAYNPETIGSNRIHMLQPRLYVLLVQSHPDYQSASPFFYYIASSKMIYNSEFIEVGVNDNDIEELIDEINEIVGEIEAIVKLELGFDVYNSPTVCAKCPAREICDKKQSTPNIKRIKV